MLFSVNLEIPDIEAPDVETACELFLSTLVTCDFRNGLVFSAKPIPGLPQAVAIDAARVAAALDLPVKGN